MSDISDAQFGIGHSHVFLGAGHDQNARKTWAVIVLCSVMMIVEIIGGSFFGSLALVADGLHMSTHASAMLIAALAYTYARKHANDRRFVFGTGKLGDLAGFTSAIILAMIALLIGYEAIARFLNPVPIRFNEAIPIAVVGLVVNVVSAWLLSGDDHHGRSHGHSHGGHGAHGHHDHGPAHGGHGAHDPDAADDRHNHSGATTAHGRGSHDHAEEVQRFTAGESSFELSIFEDDIPPVFRLRSDRQPLPFSGSVSAATLRPNGSRQAFAFVRKADFLESTTVIPEPHAFEVKVTLPEGEYNLKFAEHTHDDHAVGGHTGDGHTVDGRTVDDHAVDSRDHNIRAAYVHVIADAAVSVLAIIGLSFAKYFGWLWMDPLAGIVGACVIANWSYGLIRDTGAILVDISPDETLAKKIRDAIEAAGDRIVDLHVWRLGPGHFGAVISVVSKLSQHGPAFYHAILGRFAGLSHITVEVHVD